MARLAHQPGAKFRRGTTSLSRILSQERLDGNEGIPVKISTENQLFLNVPKPSRVRIPAALLQQKVPGFKVGVPAFLRVEHLEKQAASYHRYGGGDVWVPTAPKEVARPREALTIRVQPLSLQGFISDYPRLTMKNERSRAWMADEAEVDVDGEGSRISLGIHQSPPVEGVSNLKVEGRIIGGLVFQTGSIFVNVGIADAFGVIRRLRLYHNGNSKAWPGVEVAKDSLPVYHLTVDGVRLRLAYSYTKGFQTTTVYLRQPSSLYSLGEATETPDCWPRCRISKAYLVRDIRPTRSLEGEILKHGNNYEVGRLGAEIAYTILGQRFGCQGLVINEPAKGGKDLQSSDLAVAVQSRLFVRYEPQWLEWLIAKELKQMTKKLRTDFWHTKQATVGYAVLSFFEAGELKSLVAMLEAKR